MIPLLAFALPFFGPGDVSPSISRSKANARKHICSVEDADATRRTRPGLIRDEKPRGDYVERTVVICTERLMRPGLRADLDEAILEQLEPLVSELATAAAALRPDLADRTWLVESYYPNPQVGPKIGFAGKTVLVREGLQVSDRTPALSAGDLEVLLRMPPSEAYPAACRRYSESGSLGEDDVLLAIVHRDPQETSLHAAVCADGTWTWVR